MGKPGLADKIVLVHGALEVAGVPHAFGGALALAYYAEPRATVDIDLNLFVGPDELPSVIQALERFEITRVPPQAQVSRDGQARVWWGRTPLDLFFSYDPVHEAMRERARIVPFGDDEIPILAPEHLLVAKAVFDRPKDWLDIEQMLVTVPAIDLDEVSRWLERIAGHDDRRRTRFHELASSVLYR